MNGLGRTLHEVYNKKFSLDLHRSVSAYINILYKIFQLNGPNNDMYLRLYINYASTDGNILDRTFTRSIDRSEHFIIQIEQWKFLCGKADTLRSIEIYMCVPAFVRATCVSIHRRCPMHMRANMKMPFNWLRCHNHLTKKISHCSACLHR